MINGNTEIIAHIGFPTHAFKAPMMQIGSDMLFEQIPAYLDFFWLPVTTPDELRAIATLAY